MIVIGVDAPQGWCALNVEHGRGSLLGLGSLDDGKEADELTRYIARYAPAVVVIERAAKIFLHGKGAESPLHVRRSIGEWLIMSAEVAGEMKHACRVAGVCCVMTDADAIRKVFGVRGKSATEQDQAVAREVKLRIANWPARTNTHERDAALAALFAR